LVIEDRIYNQKDFDRTLILEKRTELVARKISEYLKAIDPFAKTIVFCEDIDHAERMRQALVNLNPERIAENRKYVMRITGDEQEGKAELDNFIDPESRYPVIATTSKLMTTGVDAQTCKLIVLDQRIQSVSEFKQIIGRGTRINEDFDKFWFAIMDFKKATELFARPDFDGDPEQIFEPQGDEPPIPPDEPRLPGNDEPLPPTEPPLPPRKTGGEAHQIRHRWRSQRLCRRRTCSVLRPRWPTDHRIAEGLHPTHRAQGLCLAGRLPAPLEPRRQKTGGGRRA
jgi:type I restriction enzyme R subunit